MSTIIALIGAAIIITGLTLAFSGSIVIAVPVMAIGAATLASQAPDAVEVLRDSREKSGPLH